MAQEACVGGDAIMKQICLIKFTILKNCLNAVIWVSGGSNVEREVNRRA